MSFLFVVFYYLMGILFDVIFYYLMRLLDFYFWFEVYNDVIRNVFWMMM